MPVRSILKYFANSEEVVRKISESNAMKQTARMMVAALYRAKAMAQDADLLNKDGNVDTEKMKLHAKNIRATVKKELEKVQSKTKNVGENIKKQF